MRPPSIACCGALETAGFFTKNEPGIFANSGASDCLRAEAPGTQRALVIRYLTNVDGQLQVWEALDQSVRTGEAAFDKVHGRDLWEYGRHHPRGTLQPGDPGHVRRGYARDRCGA